MGNVDEGKILIGNLPFIVDEIKEWNREGLSLKEEMLNFDWEYRKNHICECVPICFAADNFVDGIQETHCKKMIKARTQRFRKRINDFLKLHP